MDDDVHILATANIRRSLKNSPKTPVTKLQSDLPYQTSLSGTSLVQPHGDDSAISLHSNSCGVLAVGCSLDGQHNFKKPWKLKAHNFANELRSDSPVCEFSSRMSVSSGNKITSSSCSLKSIRSTPRVFVDCASSTSCSSRTSSSGIVATNTVPANTVSIALKRNKPDSRKRQRMLRFKGSSHTICASDRHRRVRCR